jgi:hypothetical protein
MEIIYKIQIQLFKAFKDMVVKEGEKVLIELVASGSHIQTILLSRIINYEDLKKVYDARVKIFIKIYKLVKIYFSFTTELTCLKASKGSKLAEEQNLDSLGKTRVELIKIAKSPGSKDYFQMTVSQHHTHPVTASVQAFPVFNLKSVRTDEF